VGPMIELVCSSDCELVIDEHKHVLDSLNTGLCVKGRRHEQSGHCCARDALFVHKPVDTLD
jgi:hypothetical protein